MFRYFISCCIKSAVTCTYFFFKFYASDTSYEKLGSTVKLGNKERFNKEQIGIKELIMDYQPFYTIYC